MQAAHPVSVLVCVEGRGLLLPWPGLPWSGRAWFTSHKYTTSTTAWDTQSIQKKRRQRRRRWHTKDQSASLLLPPLLHRCRPIENFDLIKSFLLCRPAILCAQFVVCIYDFTSHLSLRSWSCVYIKEGSTLSYKCCEYCSSLFLGQSRHSTHKRIRNKKREKELGRPSSRLVNYIIKKRVWPTNNNETLSYTRDKKKKKKKKKEL